MASPKTSLRFTVASCAAGEFPATAEVAGRPVEVKVPGLIVELVSADGSMSQTLRLTDADADAFKDAKRGDEVAVTYTRTPAE